MNARFREALRDAYQANSIVYTSFQQYDEVLGKYSAEDMLSYSLSRTCLLIPDAMEQLRIACTDNDIVKALEICKELERTLREEHGLRPYHAAWSINCWMYAMNAHIWYSNLEYAKMIDTLSPDKLIPLANTGDAYASYTLYARDMSQKEWLQKMEQYDHPASSYFRSVELRGDFSDPEKNKQALELCLKAMDIGYAGVTTELAILYQGVEGIEKSASESFKYARIGADAGIPTCMYMVSDAYLNGDGVDANPQASFEYLEKLAETGEAKAQCMCGCAYHDGSRGATKDLDKSYYWLKKSADQGDCIAQLLVGKALMNGIGVSVDGMQALRYFKLSADQGNVEAMEQIAGMYFRGEEIPKNEEDAAAWYIKAAAAGSGFACSLLASFYEHGIGVLKNRARADQYKRKAEELGYHDDEEDTSNQAGKTDVVEDCDLSEIGRGDGYSDISNPIAKKLIVCVLNTWNEISQIALDNRLCLLIPTGRQYMYLLIKLCTEFINEEVPNLPFYITKMIRGSACSNIMEDLSVDEFKDEFLEASALFEGYNKKSGDLVTAIITYLYVVNSSTPMARDEIVDPITRSQATIVVDRLLRTLNSIINQS